jgi:NADH:ubiquinone oxidoreductase subunit 5 (subunit L)/multisubunit Na+/H+ antiporter MnhA subunit
VSHGTEILLSTADALAAVLGLALAFSVWRSTSPWPRYESTFFESVWRWDDAYDATIGRPAQRLATFGAEVVEPRIIDGAVHGVAGTVLRSATGVRKIQSGYVRHYGLAMVIGTALTVLFLVARSW